MPACLPVMPVTQCKEGYGPMHHAARYAKRAALDFLWSQGADLESRCVLSACVRVC